MTDHGFKTCVIETLSYNKTDIRNRMKEERVKDLANSIKNGLQLHPVVVNRKTKTLIAGRDRIAANLLLENRMVWCHMVDADAREVESMERAENLYRRQDDRDALIAAEQEALAKTIAEEEAKVAEEEADKGDDADEAEERPKKPGRKKTAKGKAREQIAKKLGTSPDAVRKAAERAAKKEKKKAEPKPTGIRADMEKIREAITLIVRPLQAGQSGITKLLTMANKMPKKAEPALQRLKQELADATARLRLMRPDKVCGYCKGEGIAEDGKDCKGCDFTGYLTEGDAPVPESRAAE